MSQKPAPIPAGYHALTPYLMVRGAGAAIAYYEQVFGAVETVRMAGPEGSVMHAELRLGDSTLMLADEKPGTGVAAPSPTAGATASLLLYVPDCDAVVAAAEAAGATVILPLQDHFYGDRSATLRDPFGHVWTVATHVEDVAPAEMKRRMAALHG